MKKDFRSRYKKSTPAGGFVQKPGDLSSPDDILEDTYDDFDDVLGAAKPLIRFLAIFVDCYLICLVLSIFAFAIGHFSPESIFNIDNVKSVIKGGEVEGGLKNFYLSWCALLLGFSALYYCIFEGSPLRATPGKLLLGVYTAGDDGEPTSAIKAILRNIFKLMSILTFGVGFIIVLFGKNRTLHDLLSKTQVMEVRNLSFTRRIVRFLGLSFTFGTFLIASVVFGLLSLKKTEPLKPRPVEVKEEVAAIATPTPFQRGSVGYLSLADHYYQINGLFLRSKPDEGDEETESGIFGNSRIQGTDGIVIEAVVYEKELTTGDQRKLQEVYDILNDSEDVIGKRAVAKIVLTYDRDNVFCRVANIQNATMVLNKELSADGEERQVQLVKDYQILTDSKMLNTTCESLEYGKKVSFRTVGEIDDSGLAWSIIGSVNYLRYKLYGSSSYNFAEFAAAIFNETTGMLEVGFFERKLSEAELGMIRSAKSVKAARITPNAIGTVKLAVPTLKAAKNAPLTVKQKSKLLSLTVDNVQNGYSVWFRRDGRKIKFLGDENELTVNYPAPYVPSTLSGFLEEGRPIRGRFAGSKRIMLKEGVYKFNWSITYNTKLIYVR